MKCQSPLRSHLAVRASASLPNRRRGAGPAASLQIATGLLALLLPWAGARAAILPAAAGSLVTEAAETGVRAGVIAAGSDHTCAIKADGTVACWGNNGYGQASPPANLGTVNQLVAGSFFTCAVKTDGTVACWGRDDYGQANPPNDLGTVTQLASGEAHSCAVKTDGTVLCWGDTYSGKTAPPPSLGTVTQLTGGKNHTCAVKTDGTVACWGDNSIGQATPPADLGTVAQLSSGDYFSCAVKTGGTVACWGDNRNGETAPPPSLGTVTQLSATVNASGGYTCAVRTNGIVACWGPLSYSPPADLGTVTHLTAGAYHTCAVKTDGTVRCWGWDAYGQATPPADLGLLRPRQLSAGEDHTCVVKPAGTVACWGKNDSGQATPPATLGTVTQLSGGWYHNCAVKTDGTVACWGYDGNGEASPPPDLGTVTQLSAGDAYTCAVKTDGTVACWGNNHYGQTTPPADLGTVTQLSAGYMHTCVVKTGGSVACWGHNYSGQASPPADLGTVTLVSTGAGHSCAVKTDGTVACWGLNIFGIARPPAGLGPVSQLAAGDNHTCALKTDGTAACWGVDDYQQASPPADLGTVTQLTAGADHTCAVKTDGTVACWGDNSQGQAPRPVVDPASLPNGAVGTAYNQTLRLTAPGYTPASPVFALTAGSLPGGLTLNSATGLIEGTPATGGTSSFTVRAVDDNGFAAERAYTLVIASGDTTPPVIVPSVSGTMGSDGWYLSDVTVSWTVTDPESPVTAQVGCEPSTLNADSASSSFTCTATSTGGSASQSVTVKRDATPPTIAGSVSPGANANGWLNGPATVTFACTDVTSGIAACAPNQTLANEGANQSASGTATDNAGNSASTSVTGINIDRTPPVVTVTGVTNGAIYTLGSVPTAGCNTTDALSGVQSNATPSVTGGNLSGTGTLTASCTGAMDKAGNPGAAASVTYQVNLDNFGRADGALGSNWSGSAGTAAYRIVGQQVDVRNGGPIYWKPNSFGVNQEAFVTLATIDPTGVDQDLLLKVQGTSGNYQKGVIEVLYDAKAKGVKVETSRDGASWKIYPKIPVTFQNGDQMGARVYATGKVEVYKNRVLVGSTTLNAADQTFFNAKGGRIGLWFASAPNAMVDNFGGGSIAP